MAQKFGHHHQGTMSRARLMPSNDCWKKIAKAMY
jgi:hypothetical protein